MNIRGKLSGWGKVISGMEENERKRYYGVKRFEIQHMDM
jgi:hypothetical protein